MTTPSIFAYATSPSLRRKLELHDPPVRLTDAPPWLDPPRAHETYRCAFLEASPPPLAAAWLTSLEILSPGVRVHLLAPRRAAAGLRKAFSGRIASVLPPSTPPGKLGQLAAAALRARKARKAPGRLTALEKQQVAKQVVERLFGSAFVIQDGILCYATANVFHDLGYRIEDLVGHHFLEFLHPSERKKVAAIYSRRMTGEPTPDRYETFVKDAAGKKVPVELISLLTTFRGRPAAVAHILDVTERHALTRMRDRRERELNLLRDITHRLISSRSMASALRDVLDLVIPALGADAGTVVLSPTGKRGPFQPVAARHRVRRRFEPWSALGQPIRVRGPVLSGLGSGQPVLSAPCEPMGLLARHHLAAPLMHKNKLGGFIYVNRKKNNPFIPEDVALLVSIAGEASLAVENRRLYEDLRSSYKELVNAQRELLRRERLAVIGNMAAHVAHEIRNPVATIMNATGQIRRRVKLEGVEAELADIIGEELERLRRLCDDLVMFSRPPTLNVRSVRLDTFLDFVRSDLVKAHLLPDTVQVHITVDPPDLEVQHDPDILYALLRNLVVNSVQAMGMKGRLGLHSRLSSQKLLLEVTDDGPGIDPQIMNKIFDPFFSTRPESVGLGLAIVKNYVEELGGELEVTSEPSLTTIRLLLPPPSQMPPNEL